MFGYDVPAVLLNGNSWQIGDLTISGGQSGFGDPVDFYYTFPEVTVAVGATVDLSYAGKVQGICWGRDDEEYDQWGNTGQEVYMLYNSLFWDGVLPNIFPSYPCFLNGSSSPCTLPWPFLYAQLPPGSRHSDLYSGSVAQTVTLDSPPVITGIYPSDWYAGTTQSVTFTGQYFGTNGPTLTFSPATGISYSLTSYNDTQIAANVTVASGTPNEAVDVAVTNNGYGSGFVGTGQPGAMSASIQAFVTAFLHTSEVTVIAWVDPNASDLKTLPSGANSTLMSNLNSGPGNCAFLVGRWASGFKTYVNNSADVAYANAWLLKNSANNQPPNPISVDAQFIAGNYRLFNDFGNGQAGPGVGSTPDPCHTGLPGWIFPGEKSQYNDTSSTSPSGKIYLLVEGRIGTFGQLVSQTLNDRTVPWIWTVIAFDSAGNPIYTDTAMFPTYSVYVNGSLVATYPQSSAASFIANDETYQRKPSDIQ
jgi:hypothetical protein